MTTSYSPKFWQKSLNVMLEKSPGNCDMAKLWIVHLFEGNFNFNNKWLGKMMIAQVEAKELLAHKQYGSQKAKDAITQCFNKHLWYNYICFQHQLAALCSNDAKSCYDQIVLLAMALCLCRWGAFFAMVLSMTTTLQAMTHHVQTAFGDLYTGASCQHWDKPVAGIGQGNGMGPQIWVAICTPLFELLHAEGFVSTICCAISWQTMTLASFAFVDNMDLYISGQPTASDTATLMQKLVSQWEGLLTATGGAIVPEKCFWYLMEFEYA